MTALALAVASILAVAAPIPPPPTQWVTDTAGFMSPEARSTLDARLQAYERATGHQVIVWIGRTLEGAPLADWAVRTFAEWKIGRKGFDDGVVIFVLADDRKIDIEVGYGLEDKVPDAIASRIIREVMAPRLRAGDRDGAVTAGANAVLAAIEGKPWTGDSATAPPEAGPAAHGGTSWTRWVVGGIAIVAFLIFSITHPRLAMFMLWTVMAGGRGRGGGCGGGGVGGGGFGGGGGRSGGGGARGGW